MRHRFLLQSIAAFALLLLVAVYAGRLLQQWGGLQLDLGGREPGTEEEIPAPGPEKELRHSRHEVLEVRRLGPRRASRFCSDSPGYLPAE